MKTIVIEVSKLRDLHKKCDDKVKSMLEELFGKEVFSSEEQEMLESIRSCIECCETKSRENIKAMRDWFDEYIRKNQEKAAAMASQKPWVAKNASGEIVGIGIPIINKVLALRDLNDGKEMKWDEAMKAAEAEGKTLPTRDDWYIIRYFKSQIQALLKDNGGVPLQEDYYWSSTECSSNYAWYVVFNSGIVGTYYKYYSSVARPVAAL
ncbi:MAG: DUF1566 domain-containing protein [Bacteroidales bacterium]|nr:DUF1566 domain-containing protein [Bacteroidales bacterium]